MPIIGDTIKIRNKNGFLGLIPCIIPGYPDTATSLAITEFLDQAPAVSVIEFTHPAATSFSATANELIISANRRAVQGNTAPLLKQWFKRTKPNFIMFYRESVEKYGFEELVKQYKPVSSGILLEWGDGKPDLPFWQICKEYEIELINCIDPYMLEKDLAEIVEYTPRGGLIYLSCAPQAGGSRHPGHKIAECAHWVKRNFPDAVITASLGIRSPEDIKQMAAIPDIDAVVIGSALFKAAERGIQGVQEYLALIEPALAK